MSYREADGPQWEDGPGLKLSHICLYCTCQRMQGKANWLLASALLLEETLFCYIKGRIS